MSFRVSGWLIVLVLIMGIPGLAFYRNARLETRFARVHAGLTDLEVLNVLGKPAWIEPCGKSFGPPKEHCMEYIYRNSFAPIVPEYWSVSFNANKQVEATYRYDSP